MSKVDITWQETDSPAMACIKRDGGPEHAVLPSGRRLVDEVADATNRGSTPVSIGQHLGIPTDVVLGLIIAGLDV